MELSSLPLMLLLISNIQPGQTRVLPEGRKAVLTVKPDPSQIFRGETVTLTCDIQEEGLSYTWECDGRDYNSDEKEIEITVERTQKCSCAGCSCQSDWSDEVTLTVFEKPKAVLTVQPEPSQIFRGETVTLTCDIQGEGWTYRWKCGDTEYGSNEKEFSITAERTQMCWCISCRGSAFFSDWSNDVTLTVFEAPLPVLSVLKLVSFLLAASPYLLVTVIIGVKYYRAHAQSAEIDQYAVPEE